LYICRNSVATFQQSQTNRKMPVIHGREKCLYSGGQFIVDLCRNRPGIC